MLYMHCDKLDNLWKYINMDFDDEFQFDWLNDDFVKEIIKNNKTTSGSERLTK